MTLRLATEEDSALLASLHAAAFPPGEAWGRDVFRLQLALPNVIGLLQNEQALMLCRRAANEAEILTIAVVPAARRRGAARRLLTAASARLIAQGAQVIFLEVSTMNTAALALYDQFGFVQAGLRPKYYSTGADALILRLDLTSPSVAT